MPEGLKLVVTADVKQAEKALKGFVSEAQTSGKAAGAALGRGLNTVVPSIDKIPKSVKPAIQAVSKLGATLGQLKFAVLDRQEELIRTSDIKRAAILNAEIKSLQKEIIRVQTTSAGGINFGGVGTAATKGFSVLRQAANILPGIGIAGILGGVTDLIAGLFKVGEEADKAEKKIREVIKTASSISSEAAAGTSGESARVNSLVGVVTNLNKSYTERNRALNELKDINKNYFGDLSLEAKSLELLKQRANEYTQAIVQQAIIKAFEKQIGDVAVAISQQTSEFNKAEKEVRKFQQTLKSKETENPVFSGLAAQAQTDRINKASGAVDGANKNLLKQGKILSDLRANFDELNVAINDAVQQSLGFKPLDDKGSAKIKADDIIAQAKRLASFLDKNTQFSVIFEVDETKSEEENKKAARAFIEKAKSFVEKQTPEFKFKPLLRAEFKFINDGKFLQLIRDQAGIESTKTFSVVKKEFEDNIKRLAENNPLVVSVTAQIKTAIDREKQQADFFKNAFSGFKLFDFPDNPTGPDGKPLFDQITYNAMKAGAAINQVLAPAFQGLFSAIKAGENPLKAFFDGIGQAIEQLVQKLIAAAVQALILSAIIPGAGAGKGFGSIFKSILGFASGGIVSGPTLAMIGEGSGTNRSNPEVVAPLDQLRGILAGLAPQQTNGGVLTGRIAGNDILLSNNRSNRRNGRLGA